MLLSNGSEKGARLNVNWALARQMLNLPEM